MIMSMMVMNNIQQQVEKLGRKLMCNWHNAQIVVEHSETDQLVVKMRNCFNDFRLYFDSECGRLVNVVKNNNNVVYTDEFGWDC